MADDLQRILGELIGRLEYIKPAMENFDRISRTLSEDLGSVKKELEMTREQLTGLQTRTQDRLENGMERFHLIDGKIAEAIGAVSGAITRVKTLEESKEKAWDKGWQIFMMVLTAFVTAAVTVWVTLHWGK